MKTYNAALGVDAKGDVVPTIMEYAKEAGLRTGNVSTAEITDATPASQASHVLAARLPGPDLLRRHLPEPQPDRCRLPTTDVRVTPVAEQMARNNTADLILGGGLSRFDAADEAALEANGYDVLSSPTSQTVATETDLAGTELQEGLRPLQQGQHDGREVQAREPGVGAGPGAHRR